MRDVLDCAGMGRPHRAAEGGCVYHVLNSRAHPRMPVFEDDGDYEAFEKTLLEAVADKKGVRTIISASPLVFSGGREGGW